MPVFKIIENAPCVYSETFQIKSYHTDVNRRLTLPKLCSFFQDVAGNQTVACGVGWDVLYENNMFWVLSRLKIDVVHFPEWGENIQIRTWSNGLDGLLAIRHFQVLDSEGNEIIKAISSWLMVNSETRRLIKADEYMRDFPICSDRLFDENPSKLSALTNPIGFEPLPVQFTETDMNRHANNVSYIDRILNSFGYNFLVKHRIKKFEINFLKEALPGELLFVQQQPLEGLCYFNNIVRKTDSVEMVRTYFEWE
jgi:medium-chain acyl-[acyl-carrier-protein] hydrolase